MRYANLAFEDYSV